MRFLISLETSGGSAAYLLLSSLGRSLQKSNMKQKVAAPSTLRPLFGRKPAMSSKHEGPPGSTHSLTSVLDESAERASNPGPLRAASNSWSPEEPSVVPRPQTRSDENLVRRTVPVVDLSEAAPRHTLTAVVTHLPPPRLLRVIVAGNAPLSLTFANANQPAPANAAAQGRGGGWRPVPVSTNAASPLARPEPTAT